MSNREVRERMAAMFAGEGQPEGEPQDVDADEVIEDEERPEMDLAEESEIDDFDEDSEDADDEDSDAEAQDDAGTYTVMVDGEEVPVTLPELLAGYSRTADYTRKTQAVAERRKELEALEADLHQQRQTYAQVLPQLQQMLESTALPPEPDPKLLDTNPTEYLRQKENRERVQRQLNAVQQEQSRVQQEMQQQHRAQMQQRLQAEQQKLLTKVPEWQDEKVRTQEQQDLIEYGRQIGYSPEELGSIMDHRDLLVLRDAMRYRKQSTAGRKAAKHAKKKTVAPGSGAPEPKESKRVRQQRQRLKQTGRVSDAVPLMEKLLTGS